MNPAKTPAFWSPAATWPLTPREGAPDFNTAFTLEYDAELEEYTLRYPSRLRPGTPQNVAVEDVRRLLDECARFYAIEYIPD